ncbi:MULTISPECIES: DUF445 domain-containing protein [Arthrobacter]|uniref:DUF445 domain-containing protein n=2 Tax=Arthrobacter TaxID=1663 RepID=A0ABU9KKB3_9MICC|nr:DUF445 domain-containing protein [Arthrobacter sp. YJM1]MDP5226372.1 DUF445 domain-containing protein [Arthrobacter sp. YJM1]
MDVNTAPTPDVATPGDALKAAALARMKGIALGLLILLAVVFGVSFALQHQYPWLGYVRAAAEGGMVGALADWFAVTALFRHPMGLKIPHTAIIPRKKDQIGASLGDFVGTNFLSEDVIRAKLAATDPGRVIGHWLSGTDDAGARLPAPSGAERVAREGSAAIRGLFTVLRDEDVQAVVESLVRKHVVDPPWGPPLGRVAERVFDEGHHRHLVDLLVDRAADWVGRNHATVNRMVSDRSPLWVPGFVDSLVGDKVYIELAKFVKGVQQDPDHQVRQAIDTYLKELARDLQYDPAMIQRAEGIKAQILGDPQVRDIASRTWETLKKALLEAVEDPQSELYRRFVGALEDLGRRLVDDPELGVKVNTWVADVAAYVVSNYRDQITGLITDTVARWDAEETSRKIELQVGRDLQFIRINGTVVGSLAGLLLFTVATLFFG